MITSRTIKANKSLKYFTKMEHTSIVINKISGMKCKTFQILS